MADNENTGKLSNDQLSQLLADDPARINADKIKILIVEDDFSTQLLYEKGLFNEVFDRRIVSSAKEALEVYNEFHPDIIVLDIMLPEKNGDEILKEIRQTIGDQKTNIVMATSKTQMEDVKHCMEFGIEGYIAKPFSLRDIGPKILSYYAKKEPDRAGKADALHAELLKKSPMRLLLDGTTKPRKEDAEEENPPQTTTPPPAG